MGSAAAPLMQAYQSAPCPYCGITWNQPGAQTCANCRNQLPPPVALPPQLLRYQRQVVAGAVGLVVVLVLLVGVMPAIATSQISAANQALTTTASHQAKVDAVFAQIISSSNSSTDPAALKTQVAKLATSFNDGLTLVQSDEAALNQVDQRLSLIKWGAPSKSTQITSEQQRLAAALAGLQQADKAMTAAVNESK